MKMRSLFASTLLFATLPGCNWHDLMDMLRGAIDDMDDCDDRGGGGGGDHCPGHDDTGMTDDTGEYLAIAFAEDNDALREAANEIIAKMKTDGTIEDAYQKWLGTAAPPEVLKKTNTPK